MPKGAILILAGTDGPSNIGPVVSGLEAATEFVEASDELESLFDGAGTRRIEQLSDTEHEYHDLYAAVEDDIGVCSYRADAYGADQAVVDAGLVGVDEYEGHPSVRSLVADGYEAITFRTHGR